MYTTEQLEQMRNQLIRDVDKNSLVDLSSVSIDQEQSSEVKMLSFLEQIQNPYFFKCDETIVEVAFNDNGLQFGDLLQNYFENLKKS